MDGRLANTHGSPVEYLSNPQPFNTFSKNTKVSKHKALNGKIMAVFKRLIEEV
jgi:hypothetical protein